MCQRLNLAEEKSTILFYRSEFRTKEEKYATTPGQNSLILMLRISQRKKV